MLILALGGCGAADDEHPAPPSEHDHEQVKMAAAAHEPVSEAGASAGTCPSGAVRECKLMLSRQGSIVNCFVGVQWCSDDEWGPCQSPDEPAP
ncbi:MAG TPA: hypothetical protein VJN18_07650 [Polyangiaceae bacterium]|nr:hypothetical protein [Polyangiaceae bacterium]